MIVATTTRSETGWTRATSLVGSSAAARSAAACVPAEAVCTDPGSPRTTSENEPVDFWPK